MNNEAIEDRFYIESLDPSIRNLPEEVIKYIKSKFKILDKWEMVTHPNFLIITDPENEHPFWEQQKIIESEKQKTK